MSYHVYLTYFQTTGKYYTESEYKSNKEALYEIFQEVQDMSDSQDLPGLIHGHSDYFVVVKVLNHPHNHPALILPRIYNEF